MEYIIGHWMRHPKYSTEIAAAWEVVNELIRRGVEFKLYFSGVWYCEIDDGVSFYQYTADTAPMAICLAALEAKGETT